MTKRINKNILVGFSLSTLLALGMNQELNAQATQIFPITNQMVDAITKAADASAAKQALCKQGGLIRGSGFSAGDLCSKQDFARVAITACDGYVNGKDMFKGSKCEKNAAKQGIKEVQRAADALKAAAMAQVNYLTNTKLLICGPESLGANVARYRQNLPEVLKKIADEACGAPARPQSMAPTNNEQSVATPPARPRANAVSGATTAALQARPATVIIQSALRDLPTNQSSSIDSIQKGEAYMEAAKAALREFEQNSQLTAAEKVSVPGVKQMAPPQLLTKMDDLDQRADTALSNLNIKIVVNGDTNITQEEEDEMDKLNREFEELKQQFAQYLDNAVIESNAAAQ